MFCCRASLVKVGGTWSGDRHWCGRGSALKKGEDPPCGVSRLSIVSVPAARSIVICRDCVVSSRRPRRHAPLLSGPARGASSGEEDWGGRGCMELFQHSRVLRRAAGAGLAGRLMAQSARNVHRQDLTPRGRGRASIPSSTTRVRWDATGGSFPVELTLLKKKRTGTPRAVAWRSGQIMPILRLCYFSSRGFRGFLSVYQDLSCRYCNKEFAVRSGLR